MSFIYEITKKMAPTIVGLREVVNNLITKLTLIINSNKVLKLLSPIKVDCIIKLLKKHMIDMLLHHIWEIFLNKYIILIF